MQFNLSFGKKGYVFILFLLMSNLSKAQRVTEVSPSENKNPAVSFPKASQFVNTKLTYRIIDAPNRTFGYEILADGRLMIRQASAPALPGNEGFKTKKGAEAVAGLVIEKIK